VITDERLAAYINSLAKELTPVLAEIEREALAERIPVIRKETQSLLKLLLAVRRPEKILEVGAAVGFSALLMAEYAPKGAQVTTIEHDEKRISAARENFVRVGRGSQITLLEGDAAEILPSLDGPYDLIFMDAAKGQYLAFLPEVLRLLAPDGVLVSDNVLQGGDITESRFAVTRRNRTIHSRMRAYLYELTHREGLVTSVLPVGDGVTVSAWERA
jgi:predicted O-methyltransferase YrrM